MAHINANSVHHKFRIYLLHPLQEFVGDIAKAVVESKDEEFVRECIGILSNLNLPELDWAEIFKHFNMITWTEKMLKSNNSDIQLILEVSTTYLKLFYVNELFSENMKKYQFLIL